MTEGGMRTARMRKADREMWSPVKEAPRISSFSRGFWRTESDRIGSDREVVVLLHLDRRGWFRNAGYRQHVGDDVAGIESE